MTDDTGVQDLATLFRETAEAHHQAFAATDGADPEWALWYANYLQHRLPAFLAAPITQSRLVVCLVATDDEHRATAPDAPWPQFYAHRVLECLGPATEAERDRLALYHFEGCPFCSRVRRAIDALGIEVELRDIYEDSAHMKALREARGRATVPVLRITSADGAERWMPDSADIIRYLQATYGKAAA